jgi:hypothetical protein
VTTYDVIIEEPHGIIHRREVVAPSHPIAHAMVREAFPKAVRILTSIPIDPYPPATA